MSAVFASHYLTDFQLCFYYDKQVLNTQSLGVWRNIDWAAFKPSLLRLVLNREHQISFNALSTKKFNLILKLCHLLTLDKEKMKIFTSAVGWNLLSTSWRHDVYEGEQNWHLIRQKRITYSFCFLFYFICICYEKLQTGSIFSQTKKKVGNMIILFLIFWSIFDTF